MIENNETIKNTETTGRRVLSKTITIGAKTGFYFGFLMLLSAIVVTIAVFLKKAKVSYKPMTALPTRSLSFQQDGITLTIEETNNNEGNAEVVVNWNGTKLEYEGEVVNL